MKKLAIYPYFRGMLDFVVWADRFTDEYEISGLYAPSGLGLSDLDAAHAQNRGAVNLSVSRDLERMYAESDVLLVPSGNLQDVMNCRVTDVLETAAARHLPVLCAMELGAERARMEKIFSDAGSSIRFLSDETLRLDSPDNEPYIAENTFGLYESNATVIMVGGLYGDFCDREAALALVDGVRRAGHKATAILSGDEVALLGLHPYPASFFSRQIEAEQKAVALNRYMRRIDQMEAPDVIVVQMLGGLMPYNNRFPESFGIKAFIAACGVLPDFLVMGTLCGGYSVELMENLKTVLQNRFGGTMLCAYMSNRFMNLAESAAASRIGYNYHSYADYRKEFSALPNNPRLPVFDITDVRQAEQLADFVVKAIQ